MFSRRLIVGASSRSLDETRFMMVELGTFPKVLVYTCDDIPTHFKFARSSLQLACRLLLLRSFGLTWRLPVEISTAKLGTARNVANCKPPLSRACILPDLTYYLLETFNGCKTRGGPRNNGRRVPCISIDPILGLSRKNGRGKLSSW